MTIFSIITKEQPMATITKSITVKLLMYLHFSPPPGPCVSHGVVPGYCLQLLLQLHVHDGPLGIDQSLLSLCVWDPFPRQCCSTNCSPTRGSPINLTCIM